jgi:hypothetical protein
MKHLVFLVAITLLQSNSASAVDRMATGFPDLPVDAKNVAERSLACNHFWGEISGNGDERDKEVSKKLTDLKCSQISQEIKAIRYKYRNNLKILAILDDADIK